MDCGSVTGRLVHVVGLTIRLRQGERNRMPFLEGESLFCNIPSVRHGLHLFGDNTREDP
jgi:hypothetical protein